MRKHLRQQAETINTTAKRYADFFACVVEKGVAAKIARHEQGYCFTLIQSEKNKGINPVFTKEEVQEISPSFLHLLEYLVDKRVYGTKLKLHTLWQHLVEPGILIRQTEDMSTYFRRLIAVDALDLASNKADVYVNGYSVEHKKIKGTEDEVVHATNRNIYCVLEIESLEKVYPGFLACVLAAKALGYCGKDLSSQVLTSLSTASKSSDGGIINQIDDLDLC